MAPAKKAAPARKHSAGKRPGLMWRFRRLLFLIGLTVFAALSGAAYVLARVPLPPEVIPAQTTFITDINGKRIAAIDNGENRVAVKVEDVPDVLVDAVLATEDKHFYSHSGVDPIGIARATWADIRNRGATQGGSTITQQYVKNTYVGRERTIWRKIKEASIAIKLERRYDKPELLERYLNTVYFGRGAYGVQTASRAYFAKDVGDLELREAAYLAGLIRAPERADAHRAPEEASRRRDRTLESMQNNGMISGDEKEAAAAVPVSEYVVDRAVQDPSIASPEIGTQYFVDYVRRELGQRYGDAAVSAGGLRVKTTLDLNMQRDAYDAVYGYLREGEPAGALVSVDDKGQVKAMVGGRDWTTSKVNLAAGKDGGGSGRQAGSTFKPFLLAETVEQGYTVESALPAPAKMVFPKANAGEDYTVTNFEEKDFGGSLNLIDATRQSVNTVYAQLALEIGPRNLVSMARDLGITSPMEPNLSLVLGTSEVSVIEMAGAYSTFARGGVQIPPYVIVEVRTADGALLERADPQRRRVLEKDYADIVNHVLRQNVESGTGTGAKIGRPLAGKTGTTQNNVDAWFVGYTPRLTTAVWMGYPESSSKSMVMRGRPVTGGSFPATIFKRFMQDAVKKMPLVDFPKVTKFPGKVVGGERIKEQAPTSSTAVSSPTASVTSSTTVKATTSTSAPADTSTSSTSAPPPTATSTTAMSSPGIRRPGG